MASLDEWLMDVAISTEFRWCLTLESPFEIYFISFLSFEFISTTPIAPLVPKSPFPSLLDSFDASVKFCGKSNFYRFKVQYFWVFHWPKIQFLMVYHFVFYWRLVVIGHLINIDHLTEDEIDQILLLATKSTVWFSDQIGRGNERTLDEHFFQCEAMLSKRNIVCIFISRNRVPFHGWYIAMSRVILRRARPKHVDTVCHSPCVCVCALRP